MSNSNLNGKLIIVTGGSRGIGQAIVESLAASGAQVIFTYNSQKQKADEILKKLPGTGHKAFALNIADAQDVTSFFDMIKKEMGAPYGLVNNASITCDKISISLTLEEWNKVLNTNLTGSFLCCQKAAAMMLRKKEGSIVNISSVMARLGNPGQSNYVASKAGLEGLTRVFAKELGSRSIRVNAVAPGFIATDMTKDLTNKDEYLKKIPMGREGTPQEVADLVNFLISSNSSYITGQTFGINGGLHLN